MSAHGYGAPAAAGGARELTMFCYPWDLFPDGTETTIASVRDLGCDRLAVAVAYHSGHLLSPRREREVDIELEANVAHLRLEAGFSDLALAPGRLAREQPGLAGAIGAAASANGLKLTAWVVACHNSDLAHARPDAALETCFGDRSGHGICPSNPAVRAYITELCTAVLDLGVFDELFVESVAYLVAGHGHPHELWAVRADPFTRFLRSVCFCPSCMALGNKTGIDGASLRRTVAGVLRRSWDSPLVAVRGPDPGDELAGLLVSCPELAAWVAMRCDLVSSVVGDLAEIAHGAGATLAAGLGVFARPAPLSWMEGIDHARLARHADRLVAMPYYESVAAVARDLDYYLATINPSQLFVAQTLWPAHHAGPEVLLAKVSAARDAGVGAIGLYNLGTAPRPVLEWTRLVAAAFKG